ncbi:hypothetical protein GBA52_007696 [Prunus armeniaca]|nr:hypothetical protein GBA52_007696 [Prunus armeniaca]
MASSALMMKVEAIRKTLKVCSGSGYGKIEIEFDSLKVVQMLSGQRQPDADVEGIIYDVLMLTQTV